MKNKTFTQTNLHNESPVVVELTSKRYKKWIVISNILIYGSILGAFVLVFTDTPILSLVAVYPFGLGVLIAVITRFLSWWNHG